jgi:hypothetical protein
MMESSGFYFFVMNDNNSNKSLFVSHSTVTLHPQHVHLISRRPMGNSADDTDVCGELVFIYMINSHKYYRKQIVFLW